MATAGHIRNGSTASHPALMTNLADTFQYGLLLVEGATADEIDVILWRRDLSVDPADPAAYDTYDLSADATAAAGLNLPVNPIDNHWTLGIGIDEQGRIHIAGNSHANTLWQGTRGQHYIRSTAAWSPPTAPTWTVPSWASLPWSAAGANSHTYNIFARMTDGRLLFFMDQQDDVFNARGRDWLAYYLPTGAGTTWLPLLGTGNHEFASTNADEPQGSTADRVYVSNVVVEPRHVDGTVIDRIWVTGNWRTFNTDGASATAPFVVYSDDPLTSWHNAHGDEVTMPLTWANRADFLVETAPEWGSVGGMGIDADSNPHVVVKNGTSYGGTLTSITNSSGQTESLVSGSVVDGWVHCWHNGTAWVIDRLNGQGSSQPPSLHCVRDGNYMLTTIFDRMRIASNFATGTRTNFLIGTDVDSVGAPPGSSGGNETFSILPDPVALMRGRLELLIPDGATPRVFTFGNHARAIAS